jgi:hypothetical protein
VRIPSSQKKAIVRVRTSIPSIDTNPLQSIVVDRVGCGLLEKAIQIVPCGRTFPGVSKLAGI